MCSRETHWYDESEYTPARCSEWFECSVPPRPPWLDLSRRSEPPSRTLQETHPVSPWQDLEVQRISNPWDSHWWREFLFTFLKSFSLYFEYVRIDSSKRSNELSELSLCDLRCDHILSSVLRIITSRKIQMLQNTLPKSQSDISFLNFRFSNWEFWIFLFTWFEFFRSSIDKKNFWIKNKKEKERREEERHWKSRCS